MQQAQGLQIAAVDLQQFLADAAPELWELLGRRVAGRLEQQLAGERVAVGVEAGGGQADQLVARLDHAWREQLFALRRADDEARQVVLALAVHARHLGCLAADERAAVFLASLGEAADDLAGDFGVELAGREVVEKEDRFGALYGDVVDAVVDQALADRVMHVHREGDVELGAHAVGGADQHRVFELLAVEGVAGAKGADASQNVLAERALREFLDLRGGAVCFVDIDAGVLIADRSLGGHETETPIIANR